MRDRVAELETQVKERDETLSRLKEELKATNDDNNAKDGYIRAIQAASARERELQAAQRKRPQQSQGTELSPPSQRPTRSKHLMKQLPAVVEDSQPADYPESFRAATSAVVDDEAITEDDLLDLFPGTPAARTHASSRNVSSKRVVTREPLKDSHSQSRPLSSETLSKGISDANRHEVDGSSSLDKIPTQASRLQRPRHGLAIVPRSSVKVSRSEKRDSSLAETHDVSQVTVSKRRKTSNIGLGPVIADSQSPSRPTVNRSRKQTKTTKKDTKGEAALQGFDIC